MNMLCRLTVSHLAIVAVLCMSIAGIASMTGCEYYRVDPATGKRYEINKQKYERGVKQGEDSDAWIQ